MNHLATPSTSLDLEQSRAVLERLRTRAASTVIGRDDVIELVLIALLADGHVLLEDYPGSGKTTLARCIGESLTTSSALAPFRRIQFTPDLLPSDVTGTAVFEPERSRFTFRQGPIFAHIVLADEINRTSPKVQAAMLEAMAEKQVTVDNDTHALDDLFFVIATQNPLDVAGTYPLPTPQLDRFLFKIAMKHIDKKSELDVLKQYPRPSLDMAAGMPKVSREELLAARQTIRDKVVLSEAMRGAMVDLATALRSDERVLQGASTRSLVLMMPALQARAVLRGRDYVSPDDLASLALPVFGHRLECVPGVLDKAEVIKACLGPIVDKLAAASMR